MDFSLIVPCYNEEQNILDFYASCENVFANTGLKYEYVFINDGSSDNTQNVLKQLFEQHIDSNIVVINFSRNFGKESAIFAGLKNSSGDNMCVIDADLQQRPEVALEMYNILSANDELDCVCAYQNKRIENKLMSSIKSSFYRIINSIAETNFKNGASDFRFFNSKFKDAILQLGEYHRFSKGIFSWIGFNVHYMEYEVQERNAGESKWNPIKLFKYAMNGIIAFSTAPLKISTYVGGISVLFSAVYFVVTVIRKLTSNINVDGFTQLVLLITFFSGILLFTIGIIGEYIARIYQQVKNRPIYIANEILKRKQDEQK